MKRFYLLLIGLIAIMGYSNAAFAFDLFKPTDTDWLVENIIKKLFDPEISPFGAVSGVFLAGVLAFGGILAGYTMLVGTMNTAHDGEMLGKRWSTMWIPVRTTLGVAMILPIKNGFCAIQIIVVWLATQGIGLADQTWDAFVDNPLLGSTTYTAPATTPGLRDVYSNMVAASACVRAIAVEESKINQESSGSWFKSAPPQFNIYALSKGVIGYNYGSDKNPMYKNYCGAVALERKDDSTKSWVPGGDAPKAATMLIDVNTIRTTVFNAQSTAFVKLQQSARELGFKMAADPDISSDVVKKEMDTAVTAYTTAVEEKAKTAYTSMVNKNVQSAMKEDGFASAGSWFLKIIKAQDLLNYEINNIPRFISPSAGITYSDTMSAGMPVMVPGREYMDIAQTTFTKVFNVASDAKSKFGVGVDNKVIKDSDGVMEKFLGGFVSDEDFIGKQLGNPTEHPIVIAMNIGTNIITILGAVIAGIAIAAGAAGLLATSGLAVITALTPFMSAMLIGLAIPALYLCVYLPLLPFIIWTGTIIGWLILVVEALFAAPLWAVAHLAPDADGVVGKQGQGYMIILSLVLRPVLMVLGFVVSISLMVPAGQFINHFYAFAVAGSGSNAIMQVLVTLGSCIVYCVIIHNIMKKMLGLIHSLPDSILQWIGGTQSQILGQYASGIEGETSGMSQAVARTALDNVSQGVSSLGAAKARFNKSNNSGNQGGNNGMRNSTPNNSPENGNDSTNNNNENTPKVRPGISANRDDNN